MLILFMFLTWYLIDPPSRSTTSRAIPLHRPPPTASRSPHSRPAKHAKETTPPSSRDKRAFYIASLFGFSIALYLSTLYVGIQKDWERSQQLALKLGPNADFSDRWDAIGRNYDHEIELAEKV